MRGVHHVVEEADGQRDGPFEPRPVDAPVGGVGFVEVPRHEEAGKVQRAEVAGFIGQQGLFAAGVGAFDLALRRSGVVAVDAVKEDDAGIAALPRLVHQQVEHFAGVEAPLLLAAGGVDEGVVPILFHGLHEGFGNAYGEVEVVEFAFLLFGPDEFEDVRVIDAQDAHVRAAPGAALLDLLGGGVEDAQEGHRAGGHAAGRAHAGVLGPQTGKGEARAAAGLVDHGGEFYGVENFFDGVADGEHEAGRKLAELGARVHQRGRIGQEAPIGHHVVEGAGQRVGFPRGLFVFGFLGGYGGRYAPEEPGRVLDALAVLVLAVIAFGKDFFRIGIDDGGSEIERHIHHGGTSVVWGLNGFSTIRGREGKGYLGKWGRNGNHRAFLEKSAGEKFLWKNAMLDSRLPQRQKPPEATLRGWKREVVDGEGYSAGA